MIISGIILEDKTGKYFKYLLIYLKITIALAGVAQWIERQPATQRVAGSIPSQGTCLSHWPGAQ